MSCFLCPAAHIGLLAAFMVSEQMPAPLRVRDAGETARILARENIRALRARYGDHNEDESDLIRMAAAWARRYASKPSPTTGWPAQVTASHVRVYARCLRYQLAETADWETTPAACLLEGIMAATHLAPDLPKDPHVWVYEDQSRYVLEG